MNQRSNHDVLSKLEILNLSFHKIFERNGLSFQHCVAQSTSRLSQIKSNTNDININEHCLCCLRQSKSYIEDEYSFRKQFALHRSIEFVVCSKTPNFLFGTIESIDALRQFIFGCLRTFSFSSAACAPVHRTNCHARSVRLHKFVLKTKNGQSQCEIRIGFKSLPLPLHAH